MPLSTGDADAIEAFLKSKRGARALHEHVHVLLHEYFVARNIALRDLNVTPPPRSSNAYDDWVEEWKDYARSAKLTDTADVNNVGRWISEESSAIVVGARSGKAAFISDALAKKGVTLDRSQELAIGAALLAADQGEAEAQCRCVEVVWLLYAGQLPGEDERTWFAERRAAAVMAKPGEDPKVDIRLCKGYAKQHATTTVATLERALREKTGLMWDKYYSDRVDALNEFGYSHAALRFTRVVAFARQQHMYERARERQYLHTYFFSEHLGRGLPEEVCVKAALSMTSSVAALETQQMLEMRSTVPDDMGGSLMPGFGMAGMSMPGHQPGYMSMSGESSGAGSSAMGAGAWTNPQQQMMQQYQRMQQHQMQQQMQALGFPAAPWAAPMGMVPTMGMMSPSGSGMPQGTPPITPVIEEVDKPTPTVTKCAFCGKTTHVTEKCSFMLKARKVHREAQAEADAAKAAAAAAKE